MCTGPDRCRQQQPRLEIRQEKEKQKGEGEEDESARFVNVELPRLRVWSQSGFELPHVARATSLVVLQPGD